MIHFDSSRQSFLRRACDRCHQSKLKCSKDIDQEKCQRCLRADVDCTFSPPASAPRRQQGSIATLPTSDNQYQGRELASLADRDDVVSSTLVTQSALHDLINNPKAAEGDISMDLDGCENLPLLAQPAQERLPTQEPGHVRQSSDHPAQHPWSSSHPSMVHSSPNLAVGTDSNNRKNFLGEPEHRVREAGHTRTLWLRKIADLNVTLTEHLDSSFNNNVSYECANRGQKEETKPTFSLDQAFRLSQLFIDILCDICSNLPTSDKGADQATDKPRSGSFQLDPSAELLIFSAYLRLLETYNRILESIQLPSLMVGSFELPLDSNTQYLVLLNLTETMAMKAKGLIKEMSSPKITRGYRGDFQSFGGVSLVIVPDLALSAIRAREDALFRMIHELKNLIS
ncbi:hypothetical protein F4678DRAFT_458564 [Xylaria arbuscula]|nr:hypothetical protein F4678DRAFT_458564 [Xylaria arbuscula]